MSKRRGFARSQQRVGSYRRCDVPKEIHASLKAAWQLCHGAEGVARTLA